MLGTPSGDSGAHVFGVSADAPLGRCMWVEVDSVHLHVTNPEQIVAFAIDQPRTGERFRGAGFEINGWVIGRDTPVHGVRTTTSGQNGSIYPLDELRLDVAADYSIHPLAVRSGFSAWAPVDPNAKEWQFALEAVLANGDAVRLAEFRGRTGVEPLYVSPGARFVMSPDFVIIGTQRGGTTSLHAYLSAHPRISTPSTKELHFITDRSERGLDWYLGQFPGDLPAGSITGEATPYALFHPLAPRRLRKIAPETKLIVLLRNPIDRAYSHFCLESVRGYESLDFASALDAESIRLKDEEERLSGDPNYKSEAHKHWSYASRGNYAPQLERWFDHFPREQVLILRSEDLYENTLQTFRQVTTFLGVEAEAAIPFTAYNQSSGPALDPAIRDRLSRCFAPMNARLRDLVGWDPGWS